MLALERLTADIIKGQALVIGPLAWSEAGKVQGLHIDTQRGEVTISDPDPKSAVDRLVAQYERLFGRASHEVCREAAASIISTMPRVDVPASLLV